MKHHMYQKGGYWKVTSTHGTVRQNSFYSLNGKTHFNIELFATLEEAITELNKRNAQ